MEQRSERNFGQVINTWVQTVGILIAAGWAAYTFLYKEILVPRTAPVNISVNLQLKKIGPGGSQMGNKENPLIAVEMQVSATNPSTRPVHLLSSAWIAWGLVVSDSNSSLSAEAANFVINSHKGWGIQRYSKFNTEIVAVGSLFSDSVLKPNETVMRTQMIYVPAEIYDSIEVASVMPTVVRTGAIELEWRLNEKDQRLDPILYRVNAKNNKTELKQKPDDGYSDEESGLQMAHSSSQVSLWEFSDSSTAMRASRTSVRAGPR